MKKILILCLAALICIGISACQKSNPADETTPSPSDTQPVFKLAIRSATLTEKGQTAVLLSNAADFQGIVWSVDNEGIVQITDGVVTALERGTVIVTATWNGQTASCTVACNIQPELTIDPREPILKTPTQEVVDASFFDDAVFVGDSITLNLYYYASSSGRLGKAKFLMLKSYAVRHAVSGGMLMSYRGEEMDLPTAVAATGAKKAFIMLGMNDIAIMGVEKTIRNWKTMLDRIIEKNPGIQIYIQSMTPIWTGGEVGGLNNENVNLYNRALETFAEENGYTYINVAPYMKDHTGGLATIYSADKYVHITSKGAKAWVDVLRAFEGY